MALRKNEKTLGLGAETGHAGEEAPYSKDSTDAATMHSNSHANSEDETAAKCEAK